MRTESDHIKVCFQVNLLILLWVLPSVFLPCSIHGQSLDSTDLTPSKVVKPSGLYISFGIESLRPVIREAPFPSGQSVWSDSIETIRGIPGSGFSFAVGYEKKLPRGFSCGWLVGGEWMSYLLRYRVTPNRLFVLNLNVNRLVTGGHISYQIGNGIARPVFQLGGALRAGLQIPKPDEEFDLQLWDITTWAGFGLEFRTRLFRATPLVSYSVGLFDQLIPRDNPFTQPIDRLTLNQFTARLILMRP